MVGRNRSSRGAGTSCGGAWLYGGIKASGAFAAGVESGKIHSAVAPLAEEIVVTKHRVSAFAGTDLDLILRANGIEALILTGIITSGVVLSTLRYAADADYRLLVVGDCCSDRDIEGVQFWMNGDPGERLPGPVSIRFEVRDPVFQDIV